MTLSLGAQEHILHITAMANSLLRFMCRSLKNIKLYLTLVRSDISLVHPVLKYGTVIWPLYQLNHIHKVQKLKNTFWDCLAGIQLPHHSWRWYRRLFDLLPLYLRHQHADLILLYKFVNDLINCPSLLSGIVFSVSRGTRSKIFCRRYLPTSYVKVDTGLCRLSSMGNAANAQLDFVNEHGGSFRRKVTTFTS